MRKSIAFLMAVILLLTMTTGCRKKVGSSLETTDVASIDTDAMEQKTMATSLMSTEAAEHETTAATQSVPEAHESYEQTSEKTTKIVIDDFEDNIQPSEPAAMMPPAVSEPKYDSGTVLPPDEF